MEGAFGAAVASADFDRDGHADMAVGSPRADADDAEGREGAVTVLPGSSRGLVPDRAATRPGPGVSGPFRAARYGAALAAGDLDRDRFSDLVIGVPGARSREGRPGSGALQVIFGGPGRPPGGPRAHDPPARAGRWTASAPSCGRATRTATGTST